LLLLKDSEVLLLQNQPKIGVIWDNNLLLTHYIEDCGAPALLVTPHMLAAPFYRGRYGVVIIPSGFADTRYSRVLPALRASSKRIAEYVTRGGVVMAFGGGADNTDAYDWLPFSVGYQFGFTKKPITVRQKDFFCPFRGNEKEEDMVTIDGYLTGNGGDVVALAGDFTVVIRYQYGSGFFVISTIHEYPPCTFITDLCSNAVEEILL